MKKYAYMNTYLGCSKHKFRIKSYPIESDEFVSFQCIKCGKWTHKNRKLLRWIFSGIVDVHWSDDGRLMWINTDDS